MSAACPPKSGPLAEQGLKRRYAACDAGGTTRMGWGYKVRTDGRRATTSRAGPPHVRTAGRIAPSAMPQSGESINPQLITLGLRMIAKVPQPRVRMRRISVGVPLWQAETDGPTAPEGHQLSCSTRAMNNRGASPTQRTKILENFSWATVAERASTCATCCFAMPYARRWIQREKKRPPACRHVGLPRRERGLAAVARITQQRLFV